jgi:signal transduction histidine kinase
VVQRAELGAAATPSDYVAVFEQAAPACLLLRPDGPRFALEAASRAFLQATGVELPPAPGVSARDVLAASGLALAEDSQHALLEALERAATAGLSARLSLAARDTSCAAASSPGAAHAGGSIRFEEALITPVLRGGAVRLIALHFPARSQIERPCPAPARDESAAARLAECSQQLELTRLELSSARAELEAFGYSVSHDLRSPLRAIDGFAQALAQDSGERLDEQARHYLERVQAGARRMSSLLDDLLELSRVQLAPLERMRIDVSEVARRLAASLAAKQPERTLAVDVEDGLWAWADARLFSQLLAQLLDNAWKFTSKRASGTVRVGAERGSGAPILFVADDGVGFDMSYAQRLFSPFQRLHRAADYPGNGIGLAIARRIVTRHGGRIWAQSKPDEGSCFRFCFEELATRD